MAGDRGQRASFPWAGHAARFLAQTPDVSYHGVVYTETLGPAAYIGRRARSVPLRNTGAALSRLTRS